ncbi:MAG: YhcH/YjgK/YiaL family protein [Sedimentisphaerales bacterium]|jgi:biofilm protein TabA
MYKYRIHHTVRAVTVALGTILILTGCSTNKEAEGQMTRDHMILDKLDNAKNYYDMHPGFEKAFAFVRQSGLADLAPGRYEIDGDRLFCMISKGPGRTRAEAKLEAHRKYIDIQYVIGGTDEMGWKPTAHCKLVNTPYDAEKDIGFFNDEPTTWTPVPAGWFTIFFPCDAHAPLVSNAEIHKAVLKVAVQK